MEIISSILFEGRKNEGQYLGTGAVRMAIDEMYNINGLGDRRELASKGLYLYKEVWLKSTNPMMKDRKSVGGCNIALSAIDSNIFGFSRVKEWGTTDMSCFV